MVDGMHGLLATCQSFVWITFLFPLVEQIVIPICNSHAARLLPNVYSDSFFFRNLRSNEHVDNLFPSPA